MQTIREILKNDINELIVEMKEAEENYLINIQFQNDADNLPIIELEQLKKDIRIGLHNQRNLFIRY